jgi:hypothetical protein
MSQENVELVRQLQPGLDMDLAHVVRDERLVTAWIEAVAPFFHSDFECALRWIDTDRTTYPGLCFLAAFAIARASGRMRRNWPLRLVL